MTRDGQLNSGSQQSHVTVSVPVAYPTSAQIYGPHEVQKIGKMVKEPGQEQGKTWSSSVSLARATATNIPGFDSRAPDVSVIGHGGFGTSAGRKQGLCPPMVPP